MNEEIKEILDYIDDRIIPNEKWNKIKDYITNLQQKYDKLQQEIKIDGNSIQIGNKVCYCVDKDLIDYITNLQQDLEKANGIIEKDRQFYKCRMDEYVKLKKKNEELNRMCELYSKSLYNAELTDYESRCEGTINLIDRTIEIIKQQPTKDDSWILSRLYGFKYALNGSDENEKK